MSALEIRAFLALGLFLAGLVAGGIGMRQIDNARYEALELQVSQAHEKALEQAVATQRAIDDRKLEQAQTETLNQATIAGQVRAQLREVQKHVQKRLGPRGCITYGFVRVLDAAALGVSPDSLPLPAGKSDDSCAPADPDALGRAISGARQPQH